MEVQKILIVEDEGVVALDLKLNLQSLGYAVVGVVASAEKAIELAAQERPNLILMDVRLQGPMDGIEAAAAIRRLHDVPVIFLTSHSDTGTVQRAARTAAYGYLTKPYQIKELHAGIEIALTKARMERQLREADRWFAHTLQCVADGVIVTNLEGQVRFLNPAAEQLTDWTLEDAIGQPEGGVVQFGVADTDPQATVRRALADGRPAAVVRRIHPGQRRLVQPAGGHARRADPTRPARFEQQR